MGNLYLIVIMLISLESVQSLHVPSFFGTKTVETTEGLILFLMNPLLKKSSIYLSISSFFASLIINATLLGNVAPGMRFT